MLYSLMNLVRKGVHWRQHESSICSIFPKCVMCHWWYSFHLNITGDFSLIWYAIPLSYLCISQSPACAKWWWKHRNRYCHFHLRPRYLTQHGQTRKSTTRTHRLNKTTSGVVKPYAQQHVDTNVWTVVVNCKCINSPPLQSTCYFTLRNFC